METPAIKKKELLTELEVADFLGVPLETLRTFDTLGILKPKRDQGGKRSYSRRQIENFVPPDLRLLPKEAGRPPPRVSSSSPVSRRIVAAVIILAGLSLGLFAASAKGFLPYLHHSPAANDRALSSKDQGSVLGLSTPQGPDSSFDLYVPANFHRSLVVAEGLQVAGQLQASNILYGLTAGTGISVGSGQSPTITNTGVTSLQGSTGALSLSAGSGISISGLTITNSGITSLTAGTGISVDGSKITNSDLGSAQNIFKTISVAGQTDITAGSNTDTLTFAGGTGLIITADSTNKKLTLTPDYTTSGWTRDSTNGYLYLTTPTDNVGIGTQAPQNKLDISGALAIGSYAGSVAGPSNGLVVSGNVGIGTSFPSYTLHVAGTGYFSDNVTMATGTKILPANDLGADLGSSSLRFNNLWVANINSNSSQAFSGQTTFSYAPTDSTISQASVLINPTTSAANGQLLGFGIAGYQRALIDEDGDMILGYNDATSAPASDYPLNVYGHSGTRVAYIDTSGNIVSSGSLDINGTSNDIAGTLNLSGNALTSSGALTITPNAGNNLNIALSTTGDFAVNTNQLYVDTSSGYVGIGTTGPGYKLHIVDTIANQPTLNISASDVTAKRLALGMASSFMGSSNVAFITTGGVANHDLAIAADGTGGLLKFSAGDATPDMTINGGNVGIGTTGPVAKLDVVEGHIRILGTSDAFDQTLLLENNVGKKLKLTVGANAGGTTWYTQANTGTLGVDTGMDLRFSAGAAERVRIKDTGNVGIGTGGPVSKLNVQGGSVVIGTQFPLFSAGLSVYGDQGSSGFQGFGYVARSRESDTAITFGNTTASWGVISQRGTFASPIAIKSGDALGEIFFGGYDGANDIIRTGVRIGAAATQDWSATARGSYLAFFTVPNNSTTVTERVRIDQNGNVGIGTTSPGALFTVSAPTTYSDFTYMAAFTNAMANGYGVKIQTTDNSVDKNALGVFTNGGSNNAFLVRNNGAVLLGTSNGFSVSNAGLYVRGFVSITGANSNPPNPIGHLTVQSAATGVPVIVAKGAGSQTADLIQWRNSSDNVLGVVTAGGAIGIGTTSPGYLLQVGTAGDGTEARANAWNSLSDIRFKTNVAPLQDSLSKILELQAVSFDWKSGKSSLGFIAQDVQRIFPELISTDQNGILSLNYGSLTAPIVQAIQQLASQQSGQADQLTALSNTISALSPTPTPSTPSASLDMTVIGKLTSQGALEVGGPATFHGETLFEQLVTFLTNTVFNGKVFFSQAPLFNQDTAGQVFIKSGSASVDVKFTKEYEYVPIITLTLLSPVKLDYLRVTNETTKGFTVEISPTLSQDIGINWIAIAVKGNQPAAPPSQPTPTPFDTQREPSQQPQPSSVIQPAAPTPSLVQPVAPTPITPTPTESLPTPTPSPTVITPTATPTQTP